MTKGEKAIELYKKYPGMHINDLAKILETELKTTPQGAKTFAYSAKKAVGDNVVKAKNKILPVAIKEPVIEPTPEPVVRNFKKQKESKQQSFIVPEGKTYSATFTYHGCIRDIEFFKSMGCSDFSEPVFNDGMWKTSYKNYR
jgi:hypothetical protein